MKDQRFFLKVATHVAFCIFIILFFGKNCVLRPAARGALYKEYLSGLLLLAMIYANYLVFLPELFLKRKYGWFWLCALASVVGSGLAEMAMVNPNIQTLIGWNGQIGIDSAEMFFYTYSITLRNFGFFCFFFMLRICEFERKQKEELTQVVRDAGQINVRDSKNKNIIINTDKILYCEQKQNYTYIFDIEGQHFSRLCSMKDFAGLWGKDCCLRISRQHLVSRQYVNEISFDKITLLVDSTGQSITLPITFDVANEIEQIVASHRFSEEDTPASMLSSTQHKMKVLSEDTSANETPDPSQLSSSLNSMKTSPNNLSNKQKVLYEYIKAHPNCRKEKIQQDLQFPTSTLSRHISSLKNKDLIIYVGNWKTGGYVAAEEPWKELEC